MVIHFNKFLDDLSCETAIDELHAKIQSRDCVEEPIGYKAVKLTFELPSSDKIEEITCEDCLSLFANQISGMN